jgi:hypothetical protein
MGFSMSKNKLKHPTTLASDGDGGGTSSLPTVCLQLLDTKHSGDVLPVSLSLHVLPLRLQPYM